VNNSGTVAFISNLANTTGGSDDDLAIYRASNGGMVQIARKGDVAPDGNGEYLEFSQFKLNQAGAIAFSSTLSGTIGGATDDTGIHWNQRRNL